MRFDAVGMFWQDLPVKSGKRDTALGPMPTIPETGWTPPSEFPDLRGVAAQSIDTETKDPELKTCGPGWARGSGHMIGLSVAIPGGYSWYFPMRHETQTEYNLDPANVLAWAKDNLATDCPKIGANLFYDIGWLREEGVTVNGPLFDIQYAEALLNSETPDVSLDSLAENYLGIGKETSLLYQWLADWFGGQPTEGQRKHLYKSPPSLAGPYAEADAALPLRVMEAQWPLLQQRGVMDLFRMECDLIRLMVDMRYKGAPVDVAKAEQVNDQYKASVQAADAELKRLLGFELNTGSGQSMKRAFDQLGLPYSETAAGNPSFPAAALEKLDHQVPKLILERKRLEKVRGTFIEGYILNKHVNGRVHCQFNQLKGDETGARSGRFSSSGPNLQNIPVRSEEGKIVRDIFVATGQWRKYDYSQIEYRLLAHHALGPGSEEVRRLYNEYPDTDYHENTIRLLRQLAGIEISRRPAKTINFGLIYGMGRKELVNRIGDGGEAVFEAYHTAVPFAKYTADNASEFAKQHGYIETLLGRKSDFNMWGPAKWDPNAESMPFEEALMAYGKIERSFTNKALNRKLQGGAADVMKKAMHVLYHEGVFDHVGTPMLTVHDELDFDDLGVAEEAWRYMQHVMEHCMDEHLSVPIKVDGAKGPTWGSAD